MLEFMILEILPGTKYSKLGKLLALSSTLQQCEGLRVVLRRGYGQLKTHCAGPPNFWTTVLDHDLLLQVYLWNIALQKLQSPRDYQGSCRLHWNQWGWGFWSRQSYAWYSRESHTASRSAGLDNQMGLWRGWWKLAKTAASPIFSVAGGIGDRQSYYHILP